MKKFDVEITETFQRTVSVEADSRAEAERLVTEAWNNEDYVLDSPDFVGVDFKTVGEQELSENRKMEILLVQPGMYPQKATIGTELKDFQDEKPPIYNFEMHVALYHKIYDTFNEKYADVKQRLIPDAEVPYRLHFTPEDFYVFVIAHAYKHYSSSGTGIRTLADIYIMNQKLGGIMNWEYVDSELRGLGIFSYERESRELAQKLFGIAELPTKANLSEAEQQMLAYYLGASTYGTIENRTLNQMRKLQPDGGAITAHTKRKYLLSRIFPGREWCEAYAPTVYKYPVLLPFFWVWRLAVKGVKRRDIAKQELEAIKRER